MNRIKRGLTNLWDWIKTGMQHIQEIGIKKLILNNFWLKIIALGVAIATWLYVHGEISRGIRV